MNIIDEMVLTAYNARRQLVGLQPLTGLEEDAPNKQTAEVLFLQMQAAFAVVEKALLSASDAGVPVVAASGLWCPDNNDRNRKGLSLAIIKAALDAVKLQHATKLTMSTSNPS